ncbi:cytochrome P450 family monooxygenase (macronuclear) [Tetrahymena thermophila SB210]|uniref:Cytochrome P450 family monooxygenase n=2 Tax=Tetrahymena thermophila TaxID=5911 RepID=Q23MG6_TETTS|nr:cytochrome P450 family monooxygenase [Tetrahymena thermophila SB210]ABY59969.1 cytochrome P450 monooxygenase CYP5007A1 [Tetrahymena thermophila]EAR97673.1 cytochrome P450 family monooxygenase [Tetrahymena thermophila SB210]|eukprot:XP_001017918.1 cytochrome P450 family monooxygenase [Tetrahymena thermophila SB210]
MIKYIVYLVALILTLLSLIILRQAYKSLRLCLIYRKKYGNDVKILFYPILGIGYFMNQSFEKHDNSYEWMKRIVRENPNVKAILILSGLFDIIILQDEKWVKNFSQDHILYYKNDGNFGYTFAFEKGLFYSSFGDWKRQRIFLNSSFHFESLKSYVPIIKEQTKKLLANLKEEDGFVKLNIFQELQKITSEIITISYFGKSLVNVKCKSGIELYKENNDIIQDSYIYRFTSPYFILKACIFGAKKASMIYHNQAEKKLIARMKDIFETYEKIIDEELEKIKMSKIDPMDIQPKTMIELYLKEYLIQQQNRATMNPNDIFEKKEIIHQFLTFYFAGSETTSHLVAMTFYELTKNQQIYDKLMKEINENAKDFDKVEHSDLSKFQYLDIVFKETGRLHNAIAFTSPRVTDQDYIKEDMYLNKDLLVCHRLTQYSQQCEVLKDSDEYIPERYSRNTKGFSSFDVIPFSTGPRNCIGQHLALIKSKFLVIYFLKNFELKELPGYKLRTMQKLSNHPIDEEIVLIKRKKQ